MGNVKQLPSAYRGQLGAPRKMRILIADVSSKKMSSLCTQLTKKTETESGSAPQSNFEVTITKTCGVWDQVGRLHPDLVLMPLNGNDEARLSLCERIRELHDERHVGIIFIDTREPANSRELMVECLERGADDVTQPAAGEDEIIARINGVLRLKAMTDQLRRANHRLKVLSYIDELTGLSNMRDFDKKFASLVSAQETSAAGIGVIMFDLDHFKQVNDTSNHLMGSHVISEIGRLLRYSKMFTDADCAARYGGDEFIVFVANVDYWNLASIAEKIRLMIEQAEFCKDGYTYTLTASVGAAYVPAGTKRAPDEIMKAADAMCYLSKEAGRNKSNTVSLDPDMDVDKLVEVVHEKGVIATDVAQLTRKTGS